MKLYTSIRKKNFYDFFKATEKMVKRQNRVKFKKKNEEIIR